MTFSITVLPSGRRFEAEAAETLLAAGIRQGVMSEYPLSAPRQARDGQCRSLAQTTDVSIVITYH